ncbi:hypothetical protein BDV37DRAFT_277455 [Aspergillus pseudonomiae]|uniref:Uncharacterized protein n=1 Tax=Aspergillus pseudonomiae TaxID=1506151 RepID=A0A5N7DTK7_9EURO|nr:uncharacterized protein BDV37DRAFT_277455 [Aspergillus pseudonomiae]KAE8409801.1 hypothetical protein BDV37DRAFT_277455 [Aspergillus pseudonomiae]
MNPPKTPPQSLHPKFLTSAFKPKESTSPPPTTPEPHRDNLSDILSDSDISILDLGPSLSARNTSCYQTSNTVKTRDTKQSSSLTIPLTHDHLQRSLTTAQDFKARPTTTSPSMKDATQGVDITPKRLKMRAGSVRGALRTFSSPLLSPLRGGTAKVGGPGVNRAKTSFRGVGGVLER